MEPASKVTGKALGTLEQVQVGEECIVRIAAAEWPGYSVSVCLEFSVTDREC